MTSNDNTAAQLILFPIQEAPINAIMSDAEVVLQCRLAVTKEINLFLFGKIIYSEEDMQQLRQRIWKANSIFIKYGFSPIQFED